MWNGSSTYGASVGNGVAPVLAAGAGSGTRWPVPPWKFGLRPSDDRGSM